MIPRAKVNYGLRELLAAAFVTERGPDYRASLASRVKGRLTGTFGGAAFYSFNSTKLINVPMKGGCVTAMDPDLFLRIRRCYEAEIRPMPRTKKLSLLLQAAVLVLLEHHALYRLFHWLGFQSRGRYTAECERVSRQLTDFCRYDRANWQAFPACRQMAEIEQIIAARRAAYARYHDQLSGCRAFVLPPKDKHSEWDCIRFPIRIRGDKFAYYKAAVKRGVDCAFSFTFIVCPAEYKQAKRLARSILDLPFYLKLTDDKLFHVVGALSAMEEAG